MPWINQYKSQVCNSRFQMIHESGEPIEQRNDVWNEKIER